MNRKDTERFWMTLRSTAEWYQGTVRIGNPVQMRWEALCDTLL